MWELGGCTPSLGRSGLIAAWSEEQGQQLPFSPTLDPLPVAIPEGFLQAAPGPTIERVEDGEEEELWHKENTEGKEGQGPGGTQQRREAQHQGSVAAGLGAWCLLPCPQPAHSPQGPGQHPQIKQGREATIAHDQDTVDRRVPHPAPVGDKAQGP